jgi:hypothetical protein
MAADTVARFTAHVQDSDGLKGTIVAHLFIDSGQTVAAVKTALDAWILLIDAVTECTIVEQTVQILPALRSGLKSPVSGSEIEETANLDFSVATVPYHWGLTLLGFPASKLTGNQVNLADTDVAALITAMAPTAVLGGTYTDRSARALTAIAYAFQGTRKRRARLHEKSYTTP